MPVQAPQWTEFLLCPICTQTFEENHRKPISLGCGHTVCKMCLNKLHRKACPFDQTTISTDIEQLPVNTALLQLVSGQVPKAPPVTLLTAAEDVKHYEESRTCVEDLALYLKPLSNTRGHCSFIDLSICFCIVCFDELYMYFYCFKIQHEIKNYKVYFAHIVSFKVIN